MNFLAPPRHLQTISYAQVLNGHYTKGLFENKTVLIGATALGMNGLLTTPVSGFRMPKTGLSLEGYDRFGARIAEVRAAT